MEAQIQKRCLKSHQAANPTYQVNQLDLKGALAATSALDLIDSNKWSNMSIQAKSDVIRVLLLHKYGGVWADATLCMTGGLDSWLNLNTDFITFIRHDQEAKESTIVPWMTSWFMASAPGGVIITELQEAVINFWNTAQQPVEYFWLHRLFSQVISTHEEKLRSAFNPMTATPADPYLCLGSKLSKPSDLPMFKVTGCPDPFQKAVFKYLKKKYGIK